MTHRSDAVARMLGKDRKWLSYRRRLLNLGTRDGKFYLYTDGEVAQLRTYIESEQRATTEAERQGVIERRRVLALHRQGFPRAVIASRYGVTQRTVSRWLRQAEAEETANQNANQQ